MKNHFRQADETDYELEGTESVWVTIGPLSVWIRPREDFLAIEVYEHHREADTNPLRSIEIGYDEVEGEEKSSGSEES